MDVRKRESNSRRLQKGKVSGDAESELDKKTSVEGNAVRGLSELNITETRHDLGSNIPYKTVMISFFLLIVGISFTLLGISLVLDTKYLDSLPSIILGILCLIPGSYYSFATVQAVRGKSEYNLELIEIS